MGRVKTRIGKNSSYERGHSTLPPEREVFMDAIDVALLDLQDEREDNWIVERRETSRTWLFSDHCWIIGSAIYGPENFTILLNWARDGMPLPEVARKRRTVYQTVGERF